MRIETRLKRRLACLAYPAHIWYSRANAQKILNAGKAIRDIWYARPEARIRREHWGAGVGKAIQDSWIKASTHTHDTQE